MSTTRNTIQKDLIRRAVMTLDHPTAEEIYQSFQEEVPSISRATVYRNLNNMAAEGELKRISMANYPDIYDRTLCDHYHVRCMKCGEIRDIPYFSVEELLPAEMTNYELTGQELVLTGTCPQCKTNINQN